MSGEPSSRNCPQDRFTREGRPGADLRPRPPDMDAARSRLKPCETLGGPPGPPVVGNLFQLRLDTFHNTLERRADRYGPLHRIRIGPIGPSRNLALLRIRTVLAIPCRNFDVEFADPGRPVEETLAFTMKPASLIVRMRRCDT